MPKGGGLHQPLLVGFVGYFFGIKMKPIAFGYLFPQINDIF